jgi:hypothetical protein
MKFTFLQKQTSRREMLRDSVTLAGGGILLAHLFPATLLRASAAGAQQSPSAADLLASMRAKFNAVPLQTQKLADNVTKFSRSFLQDIFSNVSPKLGRTLTRQMLAKQLKQTTKTQGGVSSASLIWHQNIQLASQGMNRIFHDVICVTSLENANENK